MVAHQAIGVDHPVESINRFGQHLQKQRPVGVVPIDILPPVTTRSDVIKAVREFEAEGASHGGIISKTSRSGKRKDLTPALMTPALRSGKRKDLTPALLTPALFLHTVPVK